MCIDAAALLKKQGLIYDQDASHAVLVRPSCSNPGHWDIFDRVKVGTNESKSGNTNHTNEKAYASARRGVKDCPLRKTTGSLGIN